MALTPGNFGEYDYNRMVVRFTMKNDQADVACAISTDAMDQLEGSSRTPPEQREQQFLRLRDRIEARAALEIQRCRTGGQSSRRDPARDRFSSAAEITGHKRRHGRRIDISNHLNGQILPRLMPDGQDAD